MDDYVGCGVLELEAGGYLVTDVHLPQGTLSNVYLSVHGVSAISSAPKAPQQLFTALRDVLGTTRLTLYVDTHGRYEPMSRTVRPLPEGQEQRDCKISEQLSGSEEIFTRDRVESMCRQLLHADAECRGYFHDEEGTHYIRRHGRFERSSAMDPERQFLLTTYGGFKRKKDGTGICAILLLIFVWLLQLHALR